MVQRCCVPFCKSKVGDTDILGVKLKFHRMPHTAERFLEWAKHISDNSRFKPLLSSGSRVCSKHFHKEDYMIKIPFGNNPLRKEVFPTVFQWNAPNLNSEISVESSSSFLLNSEDDEGGRTKLSDTSSLLEEIRKEEEELQLHIMDSTDSADSSDNVRNSSPEIPPPPPASVGPSVRAEVVRKNTVIQQLLTRILELEAEEKGMKKRIAELRAVNQNYEQQIKDLTEKNNKLEMSLKSKGKKTSQNQNTEEQNHGKHNVPDSPASSDDLDGCSSEKKVKLDK